MTTLRHGEVTSMYGNPSTQVLQGFCKTLYVITEKVFFFPYTKIWISRVSYRIFGLGWGGGGILLVHQ